MAKYETTLHADFDELIELINNGILNGSLSASIEDGSDYEKDNVRFAVRVYERYSMLGSNRVSLTVTLMGKDKELFLSAITTGGSGAVFFKVNTWGEESFLDCLVGIIEAYQEQNK